MAIVSFVDPRFADYKYDTETREVISMKRTIPAYLCWCNDVNSSRYVILSACNSKKQVRVTQSEIEYCRLVSSPFKRKFDI